MKILILGSLGQLGRQFNKLFYENGIDHIAVSHKQLDITDLNKLRLFVKKNPIDIIVNCAAYNYVDEAEKEWKKAFLVNGFGPKNLAIISNEINAILIHFSSDYVFDGKKKEPYTIVDDPKPLSKYGESKLLGERFVMQIAKRYYLIRVSWVFGINSKHNFIEKLLLWSKNRSQLKIADDQVSSPTYTVDIAQTVFDLIKKDAYGLYHITNSNYCTKYDWAQYILEKIRWKGELIRAKSVDFNDLARRPQFSVLDNFGTSETLNYSLPSWQNATDRYLRESGMI